MTAKVQDGDRRIGDFWGRSWWAREAIAQEVAEVRESAYAAGVAAEREACAKVADDYDGDGHNHGQYTQLGDSAKTQRDIAAAIRSRAAQTGGSQ